MKSKTKKKTQIDPLNNRQQQNLSENENERPDQVQSQENNSTNSLSKNQSQPPFTEQQLQQEQPQQQQKREDLQKEQNQQQQSPAKFWLDQIPTQLENRKEQFFMKSQEKQVKTNHLSELKTSNLFIDRSSIVEFILKNNDQALFFCAPRGFGKSTIIEICHDLLSKQSGNAQQKSVSENSQIYCLMKNKQFVQRDYKKYNILSVDFSVMEKFIRQKYSYQQIIFQFYQYLFEKINYLKGIKEYDQIISRFQTIKQKTSKGSNLYHLFREHEVEWLIIKIPNLMEKYNLDGPSLLFVQNIDFIQFLEEKEFSIVKKQKIKSFIGQFFCQFFSVNSQIEYSKISLKERKIISFSVFNNIQLIKQSKISNKTIHVWSEKSSKFFGVSNEQVKYFRQKNKNVLSTKIYQQYCQSIFCIDQNKQQQNFKIENYQIFNVQHFQFLNRIQQHLDRTCFNFQIDETSFEFLFNLVQKNHKNLTCIYYLTQLINKWNSEFITTQMTRHQLERSFNNSASKSKHIFNYMLCYMGLLNPFFKNDTVLFLVSSPFGYKVIREIAYKILLKFTHIELIFDVFHIQDVLETVQKFQSFLNKMSPYLLSRNEYHCHHCFYVLYGISFLKTHYSRTQQSIKKCGRIDTIFLPIKGKSTRGIVHEYKVNNQQVRTNDLESLNLKVSETAWAQILQGSYIKILQCFQKDQSAQQIELRVLQVYNNVLYKGKKFFKIAHETVILTKEQAQSLKDFCMNDQISTWLQKKNHEELMKRFGDKNFQQLIRYTASIDDNNPHTNSQTQNEQSSDDNNSDNSNNSDVQDQQESKEDSQQALESGDDKNSDNGETNSNQDESNNDASDATSQ